MRIFIPLALLILVASCNQGEPAPAAKKQEAKMDTVKAFILAMDSAQKTIVLPGDLLPDENVQIRAKVQGYISTIKVDIGSKVTKGQVLALIDAPELNTRVQELNAKEKAAQSRYLASKDYYERIGTASKSDGVIAASELERTKNQLQADEAEYKAAQFAVSSNRQIGNYLAIVAPYNGVITKRNINVGSFVGSVGEKPLFEIENNKLLRLRVAVPEVYTNAVLIDNTGDLTTRAFSDKKFKAKLVRKSGSIDNDTRSELWEFEIPNTTGELKAGSYADVKLHFLRTQPSFVLPTSAVVTTLEKKFVIKLSNNTTQWIDVRGGFNMGDKQEIFGDVKTGDTLVLKGNEELKPGRKVAVAFSK
ncbi:efflux RND transporter periplasmic adaptor subunit [soil metagenome]